MNETEKAINFIITSCPNLGAFTGTGDVCVYLKNTTYEMEKSRPTILFPERYKEHITYALNLVASYGFLEPPSAVASVYLATRFEFYFRVLSGRLNADGTWCDSRAQSSTQRQIEDSRLQKSRISSVALTYKILKLNKALKIVQIFDRIDSALYRQGQRSNISDLGERIEWARHRIGHGEWGDISAESIFYGLLTAIVFYNQT